MIALLAAKVSYKLKRKNDRGHKAIFIRICSIIQNYSKANSTVAFEWISFSREDEDNTDLLCLYSVKG